MSNDDDDMIGTHQRQNDFMSYLIGLFPKLKWVGKGGCTANFLNIEIKLTWKDFRI